MTNKILIILPLLWASTCISQGRTINANVAFEHQASIENEQPSVIRNTENIGYMSASETRFENGKITVVSEPLASIQVDIDNSKNDFKGAKLITHLKSIGVESFTDTAVTQLLNDGTKVFDVKGELIADNNVVIKKIRVVVNIIYN